MQFYLFIVPNEEPKSPVFATFPQSATVSEGESVTFVCKTETAPLKGKKNVSFYSKNLMYRMLVIFFLFFFISKYYCIYNVTVTWLKDGKALPESSSRYLFSSDGDKSFELRIKSCTASDVGQYVARAIGKKGETNAAFALNVTSANE